MTRNRKANTNRRRTKDFSDNGKAVVRDSYQGKSAKELVTNSFQGAKSDPGKVTTTSSASPPKKDRK